MINNCAFEILEKKEIIIHQSVLLSFYEEGTENELYHISIPTENNPQRHTIDNCYSILKKLKVLLS